MCATCGCMAKKGAPGYGKGPKKKAMSAKQAKLAGAAEPKNKIDGKDFKALKAKKKK